MDKKFQNYVFDLTRPCVPFGGGMGAIEFDKRLQEHNLRLAWQTRRDCFVVYREDTEPVTYMDLMPDVHLPLSPNLLNMVTNEIFKGNVQRTLNANRVVCEYWSKQDEEKDVEHRSFVDDLKPEVRSRAKYLINKQVHGKHSRSMFLVDGLNPK